MSADNDNLKTAAAPEAPRSLAERSALPGPVKTMAFLGASFIVIGCLTGVFIVEKFRQFGREIVDPANVARVTREIGFETEPKTESGVWTPYLGISLKPVSYTHLTLPTKRIV